MSPLFHVVVCGVIVHQKKILIARRAPQKKLGGFWEFPGGKLERDEIPTNALKREIREELGIDIDVGLLLHAEPYTYEHGSVVILFYLCQTSRTDITLTDHDQAVWCARNELSSYQLLPANQVVLEQLKRMDLT